MQRVSRGLSWEDQTRMSDEEYNGDGKFKLKKGEKMLSGKSA